LLVNLAIPFVIQLQRALKKKLHLSMETNMSNISIASSLPRTILRGFKDESGAPQTFEEEALPIHLPLIPLITQWGPSDDAILTGGKGFAAIFGYDSLDYSKPYATHQTAIANAVMAEGNLCFIRRLVSPDAKAARVQIGLDIVVHNVPDYERNLDGSFKRNAGGNLIPTGATVPGYRGRWISKPVVSLAGVDQFGIAGASEGSLVGELGELSTFYPFLDVEARFVGSRGTDLGFRLAAPSLTSATPVNADLVQEAGAYVYRFYSVSRADSRSTASIKSTAQGEQFIDFTLKEGVIDKSTELAYFADDVLLEGFESSDPEQFAGYGSFSKLHFYYDNIQILNELIYAKESGFGLVDAAITPEQTINLLTAQSVNGVPYHSFMLEGAVAGGLLFTENTNHWCLEGTDGTIGNAAYDQLVREELTAFADGPIPYLDSAMYPFSCFYDSGFSMETKKTMNNLMQRADVWIVASTQDALEPLNTNSEESSIASALRAYFRSVPESEFFGTGACRVIVMGNAGKLIGSSYKGNLPFTISFAQKCAAYMGAAEGFMKDDKSFDSSPGNIVRAYKNHNALSKPALARNKDWENGLVFAQNFDRNSVFWPGLQTIYADNTSILNSFFNMVICCNLTRIGERAWRNFTGNSKLSNSQFLARVDKYINDQSNGRYDNRGSVTPRSYYTAGDALRGFSWHTDITFAGQGIKTVETLTIITKRRDEETV
jgi:hypothetical protein